MKLNLKVEAFGKQPRKSNWSKEHLAILQEHYPTKGSDYVAELVGRRRECVLSMAKRLGIRCQVYRAGKLRTSEEHKELVRKHYPTGMPLAELAELLGMKPASLCALACRLGVKRLVHVKAATVAKPAKAAPKVARPAPKPKPAPAPVSRYNYTPEQKQLVLDRFPHVDTEVLAEQLGKSADALRHFAKSLGLVKTPEYLAARELQLEVKRLAKKKAKAIVEKKKAAPVKAKRWFHYPMNSAEYKEGLALATAGGGRKKAVSTIDENGRPATVWRNAA
ncbi:hypothetical protein [Hymenobacter tenuis]